MAEEQILEIYRDILDVGKVTYIYIREQSTVLSCFPYSSDFSENVVKLVENSSGRIGISSTFNAFIRIFSKEKLEQIAKNASKLAKEQGKDLEFYVKVFAENN